MTTPAAGYKKPLPNPSEDTQPFWEYCKKHELRFQRCKQCGAFRHYPRPMCSNCFSFEHAWVPVAAKGAVHSWVTAHRAFHPGFSDNLPLPIVIVDVDEARGVRMMGNFKDGTKSEELSIGMPVKIVFDDVTEQVTIPKFTKA